MDDDLMSLRSSTSSPKKDDDLLGGFGSAPDLGQSGGLADAAGLPDLDFGSLSEQPEWLKELEPKPEAAAPAKGPAEKAKVAKAPKKKSAGRSRKSAKGFLGMTPFQRMVLMAGVFLIVSLGSVFLLVAIGAIKVF